MSNPLAFLFLLDSSHPPGDVELAASWILPVVLLVSTVATFVALRRRDASRLALSGLGLVLAALTGIMTGGAVLYGQRAAAARGSLPLLPVVAGIVFLLCLLLTVAGAVLAILGLVETGRHPERRRGRKRGILALCLVAMVLLLFLVSMGLGFYRMAERRGALAGGAPSGTPGQPVTVAEENYRITPPPGWTVLDAKKLNPRASASFTQPTLDLYATMLSEPLPFGAAFDLHASIERIKTGMRNAGHPQFQPERTERVNGRDGLVLEAEQEYGGKHFYFVHWVTFASGHFYQLITWGGLDARAAVQSGSVALRGSFQLLDPHHSPIPVADRAPEQYRSTIFDWSVDLRGTWWTRRFADPKKNPALEWGALNTRESAALCVIPVWIGAEGADPEALTHALLAQLGLPYPDDGIYGLADTTRREWPGAKFRKLSYDGVRDGQEMQYRLRIASFKFHTLLMAAWFQKKLESRTDLLDEGLDRILYARTPRTIKPWLNAGDRQTTGLVLNSMGAYYERQSRLDQAVEWYRRAFEMRRDDATILTNYAGALSSSGKPQEAAAIFKQEIGNFPGNTKLTQMCAFLQLKAGDPAGGLKRYTELFDSGFRDDGAFTGFCRAACDAGLVAEALQALERYARGHASTRLSILRAQILQRRDDFTGALAILNELKQSSPNSAEIWWALSDAQFGAGHYAECLEACAELHRLHEDSAQQYSLKGYALLRLKRYRESREALEQAQTKDPADPTIKRTLEYVAGLLGQGANSIVNTRIEAAPLPDAAPAGAPAPDLDKDEYLKGFSAYYREVTSAIVFDPGHELKTTERQVITVVDQQGKTTFNTLEFPFDPFGEEVFANSLYVKDAAGKTVATGRIEDSYVADNGSDDAATQRKTLHIPVPSLQPGYTIEVTITRRETGGVKSFVFREHAFSQMWPVLRSTVTLTAPAKTVKWETSPGIKPIAHGDTLAWTVERPPVLRLEPHLPPLDRVLPMIWLGAEGATWQAEAKDYLGTIQNRLAIDPAIREAADEAVKGKTTPADKIRAVARMAQRDLSYKAIEFGRRARIPNPAPQTLSNRYGDCKDHALLLCQLLEAEGIPARLALVSTGSTVQPGLPSLDQFNHMIVYLPAEQTGRFLDCTSKSTDLTYGGPPLGLAKQQSLILDEAHPRLEAIPDYLPTGSGAQIDREITVMEGATDLSVQETVTFTGLTASSMRASLQQIQPADRHRTLLQMMSSTLPSLELQEAEVEKLDALEAPLRLRLRYIVRQKCQTVAGRLIVQPPAAWERLLLAATPLEKRHLPFLLRLPTAFASTVKLTPPTGWHPALPEKRQLDRPFCAATLTPHAEGGSLLLDCKVQTRAGEWPAAQYAAYTESMGAAIGLVEGSVLFEKH